jgi:hypothetical protein
MGGLMLTRPEPQAIIRGATFIGAVATQGLREREMLPGRALLAD